MCMADGDDLVTVISDKNVVARKNHKCDECYRDIAKGESYHYETYVFEGSFDQHKTCSHCMVGREWLRRNCGGWIYGDVGNDVIEHISDGVKLKGLGRLAIGFRRSWRSFKGGLMRMPVYPEDYAKEYRA